MQRTVMDGGRAVDEFRLQPGMVGEPFDVPQVGHGSGDGRVQCRCTVRGHLQVVGLSERGVQNRLRELYAKLSIDIDQIVDERWGSTYSPRSRAISIAMQRGLINADELTRENEALQQWLQRENALPS